MRTLTPGQEAATQAPVTTPGYLVEIGFSSPIRLSTRGDQSWNGQTWSGGRLGKVSGIASDGKGGQKARIELINTDLAYSALVLADGVAERPCRIWTFYGDNPDDATLVMDGVLDGADIKADMVGVDVIGETIKTATFPRRFIGKGTGFNRLRPAGTKVTWGGQTYILERSK